MSCACGCWLNATPVREVIEHRQNGLLVDFFQPDQLAESIAELLNNRALANDLGQAARNTVKQRFELKACVEQLALMHLVSSSALS